MTHILTLALVASFVASGLLYTIWCNLSDVHQSQALGDMFKLTYQFIVIAVVGGLISVFAKKIVDDVSEKSRLNAENEREKAREQKALDELRKEFLRRIVQVGQNVRLNSLTVAAFRSASSYRDAMLEILKSRSELALIAHEMGALGDKKTIMVNNYQIVENGIVEMSKFMDELSKEFTKFYKVELSETQIEAEKDRSKQSIVWEKLQKLNKFGPLINYDQDFGEKDENTDPNKNFFFPYHNVVIELRGSLSFKEGMKESKNRMVVN